MVSLGVLNLGFIGIIGLILAIAVIFLYVFKGQATASAVEFDGPYPLTKRGSILTGSDFSSTAAANNFLTSGGASFQFFLYLDTLTKTGEVGGCGGQPNLPSCDSGLYAVRDCSGVANCDNCAHPGYKQLVSLYGVYRLEILNVPDASRQNAVSTQLAVVTTSTGSSGQAEAHIETVPLPPLPLQKWVMVTIAHDGRRIDMYYNDRLVSSANMLNMISTKSYDLTYVNAGDSGLTGSIAMLKFYTSRLSVPEVAGIYINSVDTRGSPNSVITERAVLSTNLTKIDSGSLLSRLPSVPTFGMPAVTLPQLGDALETTNIYGDTATIQVGSISNIYALDTPYA